MPEYPNRQFLDFEQPIRELYEQIEENKKLAEKNHKVDYLSIIKQLEESIVEKRREITLNLTSWQRVQLSRHPDRPYTLKYIQNMCTNFVELYGDRNVKDDKAMVGGFAQLEGETVMIIGQQKGINTKMRQLRNFGMANPEGYRKALRLMRLAEKFNKPIITLIDTPGAFPGMEAEERGQGEAIARNIYEMIRLKVPVICVIIGEGASGGALGIGVGDKVFMLENSWYTVISPENCSSILWRSWDHKEKAAEQLRLTSGDMSKFGLVDGVIPEPYGGAHWDYKECAAILKTHLIPVIKALKEVSPQDRINQRIEKFGKMGFWDEVEVADKQVS
jgi:acetyl-CoA carboxylase carboxyl transferase subunit alpha